MPTYQYRGIQCDHEFEVRQSFSEDPVTSCTVCGQPVRRVIHASPVVFKGSGWYVTDSRPTSDPVGGVKDVAKKSTTDDAPAKPEVKPKEASEPKKQAAPAAATTE